VMEQKLREGGIIQPDELCLMALRCGRDTTCFTTKRILLIDKQGTISTKTEYKSVPYSSIRAFEVESAGAFDADSEAKIWVKNYWEGMSVIEQDMKKGKADIMAFKRILAEGVFGKESGLVNVDVSPAQEDGFSSFMGVLKGDASQINAQTVESQFRSCPNILQADESVEMAFKCGRDMKVYTSKRLIMVDVQGIFGKKVSYTTIPYKHMRAFEVQTAAHCLDFNCETFLWTDIPAYSMVSSSMSKGDGNMIFELNALLGSKKLRPDGPQEAAYAVVQSERDSAKAADDAAKLAAAEATAKAKEDAAAAKAAAK